MTNQTLTEREEADSLAREMVAKGWDGFDVGMLDRYSDRRISDDGWWPIEHKAYPDLLDPATAALIAVEVMEVSDEIEVKRSMGKFWISSRYRAVCCSHEHLGIAAGRAWLATAGD